MATPPPDPNLRFREALNDAQWAAVSAGDGPHLVVAGAGTGKTRTLVYRVAWLVHRGVPPESILLLTFTRRAAQEMLRRAAALVDERCRRIAGGTFHAFANEVLRRHAPKLGLAAQFTILDRADAVDLLSLVRAELGLETKGRRFPRADSLVELFSSHVNTQKPLRDLILEGLPQFEQEIDAVTDLFGRYRRAKLERGLVDYDDLLVHLRDLLANHPEARQELAARYRHLLVDEFQDTNRLQAHIAALIASVHRNLMVVGDEAQSIYAFRGASFRNIVDFPKIFPGARQTLLERNYRSVQPILDLANGVLAKAKEGFGKRLSAVEEGGGRPVLVRTRDEMAQAEFVCKRVLELREQGVPLAQMAVLFRAAWHSNTLELELANHNIPFRKFGGIRFVESAHIKDLSALLRLALNPFDTSAWFRVLQLFEGVGPRTARGLTEHVLERDGDVRVLVQPKLAIKPYGGALRELSELLVAAADVNVALSARLEAVIDKYRGWMTRKYEDAALRARDFEALQVIAARHRELEPFLTELAIDPPDFSRGRPDDDPEDEFLTVSTIHSAKGLEWQAVFVINLNAGRFPSWNAMGREADFEEERRLLYVAITRAKRHLYLLKPEEIAARGQSYEVGELSPLLAEVDALETLVEQRIYAPAHPVGVANGELAPIDDREQLQRIQDYFNT